MNKRLVQRAMQKLVDQNPSRPLHQHTTITPTTTITPSTTTPRTLSQGNAALMASSAEAEEAMAAGIRADIARAEALRNELNRRRSAMSVRELIRTYGDLITALTPCLQRVVPGSTPRLRPAPPSRPHRARARQTGRTARPTARPPRERHTAAMAIPRLDTSPRPAAPSSSWISIT